MAGKRKEINKNSLFQARFRELHSEKMKTLDELADEFGATRQTVSKWMNGDSIPDIEALVRIADFYDVSTDYLLGRSDTMSADVSVRAAMEYTGLSEKAVTVLHAGFAPPPETGLLLTDDKKKQNLDAASQLIQSPSFREILTYLLFYSDATYFSSLCGELFEQYWGDGNNISSETDRIFSFKKQEDRNDLMAAITMAQKRGHLFQGYENFDKIMELDDDELIMHLLEIRFQITNEKKYWQYLATNALSNHTDSITKRYDYLLQERFRPSLSSEDAMKLIKLMVRQSSRD